MSSEGSLVERVHIPAFSGGGVEVREGQRVKVIAVQGRQVGDLFAFVLGSRDEYLSPGNTMGKLRSIYPVLGEPFYSNKRNPLLLLEEDTVGVHDLLAPACDEYLYRDLGFEEHPSCRGKPGVDAGTVRVRAGPAAGPAQSLPEHAGRRPRWPEGGAGVACEGRGTTWCCGRWRTCW